MSLAVDSSNDTDGAFHTLEVLMVAGAPVAIARALWRRPVVDIQTTLNTICIYVLVGHERSVIWAILVAPGVRSRSTRSSSLPLATDEAAVMRHPGVRAEERRNRAKPERVDAGK